MSLAIMYATQLLSYLPSLLAAGKDITALVASGSAALQAMQNEKRNPTAAEWQALNETIFSLQTELHAGEVA